MVRILIIVSGIVTIRSIYSFMKNQDFVNSVRQKYAPSVRPIDRDRYTDIPGMEGPFMLRSGKVVYYDPKEGKYYDRDSDMYMSDEEYHAHSNPRNEGVDFYKFWCILEDLREWDSNDPDEGPKDHMEDSSIRGEIDMRVRLGYRNGAFYDMDNNKSWPMINYPALQGVVGVPDDVYTLETRVIVIAKVVPGYDRGGGFSKMDELMGAPVLDVDGFVIRNERTGEEVNVPDIFVLNKIVGIVGNPVYRVDYDLNGEELDVRVE